MKNLFKNDKITIIILIFTLIFVIAVSVILGNKTKNLNNGNVKSEISVNNFTMNELNEQKEYNYKVLDNSAIEINSFDDDYDMISD